MIGKWYLNGYSYHGSKRAIRPKDHGFSWDFSTEVKSVGNGANFWPYVFRNQPIRWIDITNNRLGKEEYLTDRVNIKAVDFVTRHRHKASFLLLSHFAPHTILNGRPDLVQKYRAKHPPGKSTRNRCYLCENAVLATGDANHHWASDHNPHLAAMLESIDHGVGMLMKRLRELGLHQNTIFIFTSENRGETNVTSNAPFRGGKSELYGCGIHIPLIIRWRQSIPAGVGCNQPTQNTDFYPTLLAAGKIRRPRELV